MVKKDELAKGASWEEMEHENDDMQPHLSAMNLQSSVRSCMEEYKRDGKQAAIDRAFNELDIKKNGQLDRSEINAFMTQAAELIGLKVAPTVIDDAVDALMDDVGASLTKYISKDHFDDIFQRHPDLLKCFDDEASVRLQKREISTRKMSKGYQICQPRRSHRSLWQLHRCGSWISSMFEPQLLPHSPSNMPTLPHQTESDQATFLLSV
uniref:EF-hand domain-containing protein n=1 Tax=Attheya septentrionalis TaxID=420275 RepID=A0A7S2UBI6_9STRA|mmetsp:Transcript_1795/g.3183  ORF Transcript_1795/g.3183 Transcript_1795/m.3183 type:complete len:209 (+) Transcript_1795:293-919(+)